ncbi:porin [Novosphingobium colocasiae]
MRSLLASTAIVSSFFSSAHPSRGQGRRRPKKENAALRAEIQALKARLEAIEAQIGTTESRIGTTEASASAANDAAQQAQQLAQAAQKTADAAKNAKPAVAIGWKGSPQFTQDDKAFKVKGRIQADASYVSAPGALQDRGLGFSSEMRRIRLGGEGSLGAGFGYKLELELSDNSVDLVDTFVTYRKGSWLVQLGNQNPAWSLDELTGDTSGSVMERAAFTDAFNFERRAGRTGPVCQGADHRPGWRVHRLHR